MGEGQWRRWRGLSTKLAWVFLGVCLHSVWVSLPLTGAPATAPWQTEQTLSRQTLFSNNWLSLEKHKVKIEDQVVTDWMWVNVPDMVNILVHEDSSNSWLLVKLRKYGLNGSSIAPIGGYVEKGETPMEAARREVFEELGLKVTKIVFLGSFRTDANRGFGTYYAFIALHGQPVEGHIRTGDLESAITSRHSIAELGQLLSTNAFKEVKWSNTVALGLQFLQSDSREAKLFRESNGK